MGLRPAAPSFRTQPASPLRAALGWLGCALAGIAILARPSQAQQLSATASVTLIAHVPPGVHVVPAAITQGGAPAEAPRGLGTMSVNTAYRVEVHQAPGTAVVLYQAPEAGLVPWDAILAGLPSSSLARRGDEPIILDLVIRPAL